MLDLLVTNTFVALLAKIAILVAFVTRRVSCEPWLTSLWPIVSHMVDMLHIIVTLTSKWNRLINPSRTVPFGSIRGNCNKPRLAGH